ncbi:hypothetical protein TWF281_011598 [Arthrobotrys megalospora]
MVSIKRRRAGLKARETYLNRLRGDGKPGFGRRLWTDGYLREKNKALWKKVNDAINGPDFDSTPLGQEIAKARAEEKRLKRERLRELRRKQRLKTLEQNKNAETTGTKKKQRGKAKAAR